jgi:putative transposase
MTKLQTDYWRVPCDHPGESEVSPQLQIILYVIRIQKEHHKTTTFKEEFLNLLEKYKIPYDERFIWE